METWSYVHSLGEKKIFFFFFLSSVPDGENFRLGMSLVPT